MSGTSGLLIAHGSPDPRHAVALRRLTEQVATGLAPMRCELAFLDHDEPRLADWVSATSQSDTPVRAVGLLLASGYHAQVDIPRALETADGVQISNLGTLGVGAVDGEDWLLDVLDRHAAATGAPAGAPVVLVAAGSSQESARSDLRAVCERWLARRRAPVAPAAVTGPDPRPYDVVSTLLEESPDVVVVPLMLAPGTLSDRMASAAKSAGARVASTITSEDETPPELVGHLARLLRP